MAIERQKRPLVSFMKCKDNANKCKDNANKYKDNANKCKHVIDKCDSNLLVYSGGPIRERAEIGEMDLDRWGINGGFAINRDLIAVTSDADLQKIKQNIDIASQNHRCDRGTLSKKDICHEVEYVQDMLNAEVLIRTNVMRTIKGFQNTVDYNVNFKKNLIAKYRRHENTLNQLIDDFPKLSDTERTDVLQDLPLDFKKNYFASRPFLQTFFDSHYAIKFSYNCHINNVLSGDQYKGWFSSFRRWVGSYNSMYWLEDAVDRGVGLYSYSPKVSSDKYEQENYYKTMLTESDFSNKEECDKVNLYLKKNFEGEETESQWEFYNRNILHSDFVKESKELVIQTDKLAYILANIVLKDSLMSNLRTKRLVDMEVPAIKRVIGVYKCNSIFEDKSKSEFLPVDQDRYNACQEMEGLLHRATHQSAIELWTEPEKFWPRGKYHVVAPSIKSEGYALYLRRLDRLQITQAKISNLEANMYTYNLMAKDLHCEDLEGVYDISGVASTDRVNYCSLIESKKNRASSILNDERFRFQKLDERIVRSVSGDATELLDWYLSPFVAKLMYLVVLFSAGVLSLWGGGKLLSYVSGCLVGLAKWSDLWSGINFKDLLGISWLSDQLFSKEQENSDPCMLEGDIDVDYGQEYTQSDDEYYEHMKFDDRSKPSASIDSTRAHPFVGNSKGDASVASQTRS